MYLITDGAKSNSILELQTILKIKIKILNYYIKGKNITYG